MQFSQWIQPSPGLGPNGYRTNHNVIITSKRRRFDVIMTLSLRCVSIGVCRLVALGSFRVEVLFPNKCDVLYQADDLPVSLIETSQEALMQLENMSQIVYP